VNLGFKLEYITGFTHRQIYSIKFDDKELNEFRLFFSDENVKSHKKYNRLIAKIGDLLTKRGFRRYFFKFDQCDDSEILGYIRIGSKKLRLYCAVYSENFIIFGSGGIKNSAQRQGTIEVDQAFERLRYAEAKIAQRIGEGNISYLSDNKLTGYLNFSGD